MTAQTTTAIEGLTPSPPHPLPFGNALEIRAFTLTRDAGDLLIYATPDASGEGITRQYLNHWHEATFATDLGVPVFVHQADRAETEEHLPVRASFSRRHTLDEDFEVIPIPGHTPGATAFLWDTGDHRLLFTGDTVVLRDGEWRTALLDSSDRAAYVRSLELMRELDFDVLVPWVASAGGPYLAHTDREDAQLRIDAMIERI